MLYLPVTKVLEGVLCVLRCWKLCAMCLKRRKRVLYVARHTGSCRSCAGGSEWCAMCAGVHALHAGRYSGGRGGPVPFAGGARVMRFVLKLRALRVVSAGSCAPC